MSHAAVGLGIVRSLEIEANIDVVWEVLLDVGSYASVLKTTRRIENLDQDNQKSLNPVQAGSKFREDSLVEGRVFDFTFFVTVVKSDNEKRTLCIATTIWQSTGTSTQVLTATGENSSRLEISYGMVPNGCYGRLYLWLFRKRITKDGYASIESDLADFCRVAVAKQARKTTPT